MRASTRLAGTLVVVFCGCAASPANPPSEAGAGDSDPKRFFLTSLSPANQYVIEGPAIVTYVEPKASFSIGKASAAGPQYVGPLSGPLTGQLVVPEGYFVAPQNPEGAVYSGLCMKAPTCFRFMGAPQGLR